jgi:hypothetical protein
VCPHKQDFLQVLAVFAGFDFDWPPAVRAIFNAFSLVNFNFELLAPECSVSINFDAKWCGLSPAGPALCAAYVTGLTRAHPHPLLPAVRFGRLCRFIVQSLPLILVGGIAVVVAATRVVQLVQTRVLHVIPFGSLGQFSLSDVCVGILVSGLFMMYFGACV